MSLLDPLLDSLAAGMTGSASWKRILALAAILAVVAAVLVLISLGEAPAQ